MKGQGRRAVVGLALALPGCVHAKYFLDWLKECLAGLGVSLAWLKKSLAWLEISLAWQHKGLAWPKFSLAWPEDYLDEELCSRLESQEAH